MNDKAAEDTLRQIFEALDDQDSELEGSDDFAALSGTSDHLGDIDAFNAFNEIGGQDDNTFSGFSGFEDDFADEFGQGDGQGDGFDAFLPDGKASVFGALQDAEQDGGFSGFADIDDFNVDNFQQEPVALEVSDPGVNWGAIFWLLVLLVSSGTLIYSKFQEVADSVSLSRLEAAASKLDSDIREIGHQALLAATGKSEPFEAISFLQEEIDSGISMLKLGSSGNVLAPVPDSSSVNLVKVEQSWNALTPEVIATVGNQGAVEIINSEVDAVNSLIPDLLAGTDEVVNALVQDEASLQLVNLAGTQRFLMQRIKSSVSELVSGGEGWEAAATQFGQDVIALGQASNVITQQGGSVVSLQMGEVDRLYEKLVESAGLIMANVGGYFAMRSSAEKVVSQSDEMKTYTRNLQVGIKNNDGMMMGVDKLPLLLGLLVIVSVLALFWSVLRHSKKFKEVSSQRSQVSEDAVIKLLDEIGDLAQGDLTVEAEVTDEATGAIADSINFAVGEMRSLVVGIKSAAGKMNEATEGTESLIAGLLTSSDSQSQEILNSAEDVTNMTDAINRMSESASVSSAQARLSTEAAQKGADAVRNTVRGMNTARHQIQETAKQLKRLGESSQQINEIVNLIQDVTEQTNVLSLNASIQAAMAGEAGRGFAVVAEEVQRLAERSARASNEITELVKNIQQDANSAIASMEATTEEVVSGATTADEAGRALNEIESVSQTLLDAIEKVAEDARSESQVAQTVVGRMTNLQSATSDADLSVSQVAIALEQMRSVADQLNQSISGFKLPETT
jgi:twitching motility protein PilJ